MIRWIFSMCAILVVLPAWAETWSFDVFLDKQKIGKHVFELNNQKLVSEANFKVKVLFVNAYQYQHRAEESWQDNCLRSLQAHTVENKQVIDVSAEWQSTQLNVVQGNKTQTLPGCVMTFAYWNPQILKQRQLLNPQNAEYLDVSISDDGMQPYTVRGEAMQVRQYHLNGRFQGKSKLNITLWYDQQQRWVGLKSITPEGYVISYQLN